MYLFVFVLLPSTEYICHVYVRSDNLSGVVIADHEYPQRVAHTLINKVNFQQLNLCMEILQGCIRCEKEHDVNKKIDR